jgi:hypothetical protein
VKNPNQSHADKIGQLQNQTFSPVVVYVVDKTAGKYCLLKPQKHFLLFYFAVSSSVISYYLKVYC